MASGPRENPKGNKLPEDGRGPETLEQGGGKSPFKKRSYAGGAPDETADMGGRKTPAAVQPVVVCNEYYFGYRQVRYIANK